jgi:carboxyl-terminal processing protease
VQQRNASGQISVERDSQAGVAWDGPLGILINRGSASASEIFAAAIQDYGRGLIMGEASFGKGTVQTMVNLDQMARNSKPTLGELKMTVAQFFRINGGTTQLRGVRPDIVFPAVFDEGDVGEASFDNALPWVQIKATDYSPVGDLQGQLPILLTMHETRVKNDQDFRDLQEDIAELKSQRKKNLISLNEAERRKERDAREARLKSRKSQTDRDKTTLDDASGKEPAAGSGSVPADDGLQADERNLSKELAAEKVRKDAKDVLLIEAIHILGDQVDVLKTSVKLAARPKPASRLTPD